MPEFVFGYGSLVNAKTHDYKEMRPAHLEGWRRRWCQREDRPWAFLAVRPSPGDVLSGVTARVPQHDWAALDQREASYTRDLIDGGGTALYWVADGTYPPVARPRPILLSYLDVCAEGYHDVFGPTEASAFFDATDGWDLPVIDDRAEPIYMRHTGPDPHILERTDRTLSRLGVRPRPLSSVMKELE